MSLFLFLLSSLPSLLLLPPFSLSLSSSLSLPLLPPFSLFSLPFSFFSPLLLSSSFPLLSLFLPSLFSLPFSLFLSLFYLSPFSPAFLPPAAGRLGGHRASGDSALRVVEAQLSACRSLVHSCHPLSFSLLFLLLSFSLPLFLCLCPLPLSFPLPLPLSPPPFLSLLFLLFFSLSSLPSKETYCYLLPLGVMPWSLLTL